jgi:hypothetical protein
MFRRLHARSGSRPFARAGRRLPAADANAYFPGLLAAPELRAALSSVEGDAVAAVWHVLHVAGVARVLEVEASVVMARRTPDDGYQPIGSTSVLRLKACVFCVRAGCARFHRALVAHTIVSSTSQRCMIRGNNYNAAGVSVTRLYLCHCDDGHVLVVLVVRGWSVSFRRSGSP